jgi:hypothetical protein
MTNLKYAGIGAIVVIALIVSVFSFTGNVTDVPGEYDEFAKCLTEAGVKMYGAYWCSHCQNQKDMFGNSWNYINYIECSLPNRGGQTSFCTQAGIGGYPTWETQSGERFARELTFEQLSQLSGCALN